MVHHQPTCLFDPGMGTLDDPPFRENSKALGIQLPCEEVSLVRSTPPSHVGISAVTQRLATEAPRNDFWYKCAGMSTHHFLIKCKEATQPTSLNILPEPGTPIARHVSPCRLSPLNRSDFFPEQQKSSWEQISSILFIHHSLYFVSIAAHGLLVPSLEMLVHGLMGQFTTTRLHGSDDGDMGFIRLFLG